MDSPCNGLARTALFKRASPAPEPGLGALQAPAVTDWSTRRSSALESLQKGADALALAKGIPGPAAYAEVLETPEGRQLYAAAL